MEKYKGVLCITPPDLVDKIENIKNFQTERNANELWACGENHIKKEEIWPENITENKSKLEYAINIIGPEIFFIGQYCRIRYNKINFFEDEMKFNYLITRGTQVLINDSVFLRRSRFVRDVNLLDKVSFKKFCNKNIWKIEISENGKTKEKVISS